MHADGEPSCETRQLLLAVSNDVHLQKTELLVKKADYARLNNSHLILQDQPRNLHQSCCMNEHVSGREWARRHTNGSKWQPKEKEGAAPALRGSTQSRVGVR